MKTESLTIAERAARGRETHNIADHAIIPAPLDKIELTQVLSDTAKKAIEHRRAAGWQETRYIYRAPEGDPIMAVCRFDAPNGEKDIRPMRCTGKGRDGVWLYAQTSVDPLRPLYNLDKIAAEPAATLLFCEGEKAADAASATFPGLVATTWPNGAASVGKIDFRDAAQRETILWPDNDASGRAAMEMVAAQLIALGATVRIVDIPAAYPAKWDLADPVPPGLPENQLPAALLAAARRVEAADVIDNRASRNDRGKPAAPAGDQRELYRFFHAARFLGTTGRRKYGCGEVYKDWLDLRFAAKNTFGEAGFAPFVELSREYGGPDDDEKFRREWDAQAILPPGEGITSATFFKEAIENGWEDPTKDDGGSASGGGERASRADPASVVLEQSAAAGDELWTDQHGKTHVTLRLEDADGASRIVHTRVGGKRHKGAVSRRYRAAHKTKVLSAEQEKRAMLLLDYDAKESGVVHESAIRGAMYDGGIFVDLGRNDGKAVRVDGTGWSLIDEAPVRFVRGSRGALPLPESGGSLDDFKRHLNLSDGDVLRVVAFLIGALAPLTSFPILLIEGRQGTAKSTIGDVVLALCDPPHTPKGARITLPRGEQNLLVHASGVRVVFVDNLSDISDSEADSLCRLATGGGTSTRELYDNEGEVQLNATRPTVVTAIGTPTPRGDFLDRCVRVTAQPITLRRTEEDVYAALAEDLPRMFGFVLDALSCALRNKAAVAAAAKAGELRLSRMADFGLYAEAAAEALGIEPGAFSAELLEEQAAMQAEGALGEPLGDALVRYFSAARHERKELAGHATEFLDALKPLLTDPAALPAGNKLKGALRRIEPGLADLGMEVEVREPKLGVRNRKAWYRVATNEGFVPVGEPLPF